MVVKALSFNTRFLGDLLDASRRAYSPRTWSRARSSSPSRSSTAWSGEIRQVRFPAELRRRLEFFASQFEFFDPGGDQFEYKTKDTVQARGADLALLSAADTGRDRIKDLGSQTQNGLSVRALLTALTFVKAMAYFRGSREVSLEDLRQILPFVLHDKLVQETDSPFFEAPGNAVYRVDRISWIRKLFDLSCAEYDRLEPRPRRPRRRAGERVRAQPGGRRRGHGAAAAGEDRAAGPGVVEGTQALRPPLRRPA